MDEGTSSEVSMLSSRSASSSCCEGGEIISDDWGLSGSEKSHPWTPLLRGREKGCGGCCSCPARGPRRQQIGFVTVGLVSLLLIATGLAWNFMPGARSTSAPAREEDGDDDALRTVLESCDEPDPARATACGAVDRRGWCDSVARRSNLYALCFSACLTSGPSWMAQCAWQAVNQLPAVCAGEFDPVPPEFADAATHSPPDACEAYAACAGCDGSAHCGVVMQFYREPEPKRTALAALEDDLDEWCRALGGVEKTWTAAKPINPTTLQDAWAVKAPGETLVIEEHFLYGQPAALSGVFLKQAYAFWRFVLNDQRRVQHRGVRATTRSYADAASLLDALSQRELASGALVFLDVLYQAMDAEYAYADLVGEPYNIDPDRLLEHGDLPRSELSGDVDPTRSLDFLCVYQHTPDVLLRSKLVRSLLSYERPLVIVLAGDFDCRLRDLPHTHHHVVFPNDGACASQVDGRSRHLWWPEGLEGLDKLRDLGPVQAVGGFAADATTADLPVGRVLLDAAFSVTPRKPSRVALLDYLDTHKDRLLRLADASGMRVRLKASVYRQRDAPSRTLVVDSSSSSSSEIDDDDDSPPVFALAPAGDTWSSGRVLEALLSGSVPVVDATYATDGVSAKGCDDPAKFWREGAADFPRAAPFVFVRDWTELPDALVDAGALDPDRLDARLRAVQTYREALLEYLRSKTLDAIANAQAASPSTTCRTVVFNESTTADLTRRAARYYDDPHWFRDFHDSPAYPGSGCTTRYFTDGRKTHGALCFDPACAPPTVYAFRCAPSA